MSRKVLHNFQDANFHRSENKSQNQTVSQENRNCRNFIPPFESSEFTRSIEELKKIKLKTPTS